MTGVRRGLLAVLLATVTGAAMAPSAAASGTVLAGSDRALLLPPAGAEVVEYENAGYRLRLVDSAVEIDVDLAPLGSQAPFTPPGEHLAAAPESVLARAVTAGSGTLHEAASRILAWIAGNVRYDLDRAAPQDPRAVLSRRTAYCTGYARLAVALLGAVGIEAREVAGYVVGEQPGVERTGFHRWIEIHYPDRGWVFSDPLASHGFVPATYLRLASDHLASESPGPALLLGREDRTAAVDVGPGADSAPVRIRANDGARRAAALRIELESGRDGEAVLEGEGARRSLALPAGRGTFVGLGVGRYQLQVSEGGRVAARKEVTFRDRVFAEMRIPARPDETTGGTMR
jgi:hypothetical protein